MRASGIASLTPLCLSQSLSFSPRAYTCATEIFCKISLLSFHFVSSLRCSSLLFLSLLSSLFSLTTDKFMLQHAHTFHAKRRLNDDHRPPWRTAHAKKLAFLEKSPIVATKL